MSERFVILAHSGYKTAHWDLMLPAGDMLATWQCPRNPADLVVGQTIPCRKLPDHRRAYLGYEGPVSRGRGTVRRVEAGLCERISADDERWEFRLAGRVLRGRFELNRTKPDGDEWTLHRVE